MDSGTIEDDTLIRLADEFTRAAREGKGPDVEEYALEHPDLALRIRDLFPTLLLLEAAAGATGNARASEASFLKDTPAATPSLPRMEGSARFIPGTILTGRYRIIGMLGRGGMGEVYRAEDLRLDQTVALKFLSERMMSDPAARERHRREISLARRVSHPNVCNIFDIAEAEGRTFLSMEYIDGEDLASLLRWIGRLPPNKAVEITIQLCSGLAAAHENDVLHRDLKPSNIMIDGRGRVRITDFGLAKLVRPKQREDSSLAKPTESLTKPGAIVGTVAYMSPEQAEGRPLDARSDVFSLGTILHEMVTGQRAFKGDSNISTLAAVLHDDPEPVCRIVEGIPQELERIITKALTKDREARYQSAKEILSDLNRLRHGQAVQPRSQD